MFKYFFLILHMHQDSICSNKLVLADRIEESCNYRDSCNEQREINESIYEIFNKCYTYLLLKLMLGINSLF